MSHYSYLTSINFSRFENENKSTHIAYNTFSNNNF